ncbi:MAG: dihydrolipoyl dehydrogenase [Candidatus Omnitrophica bacterium]|nr:dihydrolipoyl dehydrogenase [Candidatus Omnitrophota bacterium]
MPKNNKILVIGGGPGGYTAAFRASELGAEVTLVDKDKSLGGACLNYGCIPSKTLLHAAKIIFEAKVAESFGIKLSGPVIDLNGLRQFKEKTIAKLNNGLAFVCRQKKVIYINGEARFTGSNSVTVSSDGKLQDLSFDKAIIAAGSKPIPFPGVDFGGNVWDSALALNIEEAPNDLLIIGGGYIGLELGTVYAALGSKVTLVEMAEEIIPGVDEDLTKILKKRLKNLFAQIFVNAKISGIDKNTDKVTVTITDKDGNQAKKEFDKVLASIGRMPEAKNLGLEKTKVTLSEKGFIKINERLQTSDSSIYAVGDITGNPLLAHKASMQGKIAAEVICGLDSKFSPKSIPGCIYTDPEIAVCGLSESEAKLKGIEVKVLSLPWIASGKATTLDRTDGLTKILVNSYTKKIVGAGIVGVGASELIYGINMAVENSLTIGQYQKYIHPHPTLSETLLDTAWMFKDGD